MMTTIERDRGRRRVSAGAATASRDRGDRRSLVTFLAYAVPLAGASYLLFFVQFYFLKFATDELLLAPAAVGLLFGLAKTWDAVSDPLVGHWSDRTRSRLGRRRPWMWAALPPLGACFVLLWLPPAGAGGGTLLAWVGMMLFGLYTALTLYMVPHASLGAELSTVPHERTRLFGLRHVAWTLGLFASFAAIQVVAGSADPRGTAARMATGTAVLAVALLAVTPAAVREPAAARRGSRRTLPHALRDVWNNPHARLLLAVWFIESLGAGMVGVLAPYMAEYVLIRPDLMGAVPAVYVAAGVLAVPFWVHLARRRGRKAAWLVAMVTTAFAFGAAIAVGEGDVILLCALMAVAGAGMGCGGAVGAATLTDVIDYDERCTGARQEGVYSAAWGFVLKLAVGLVTAGVGITLQAVGFVPNRAQDPVVSWTLRGLFVGVPCLAFLAGAILFRRFSLPESIDAADGPAAPDPLERTPRTPLPMRPQGLAGRLFGIAMERLNAAAYRRVVELLAPRPRDRILEIGFGTGRLVEMLVTAVPDVRVAGVDPTPTMMDVARRRRGVRAAGADVDLRLGGDAPLPWPARSFDAAVALHSFQFWPDPERSLAELRRVLKPGGRCALVLRDHSRRAPEWLPNPLSRSGGEAEAALALLQAAGFEHVTELAPVGSSRVLTGTAPEAAGR